jgi:organic radical activating enzyme
MKVDLKASFTAADSIPLKLFHHPKAVRDLRPLHVQWLPTNHCNLNCPWCSCAERDKQLQMDADQARNVIQDLADLGCLAVTITGGGEPLCHPRLADMIGWFYASGISVGLVTNGLLLDRLDADVLSLITWCRISNGDHRELNPRYRETLEGAVKRGPRVDWAFSHVVSNQPNHEEIHRIVEFANEHGFTHVRLVADILDANNVPMGHVRAGLRGMDERVIYQSRDKPVPASSCLIGYIKPLIAPDFKMYLCCGVQYALDPPSKDLPEELSMGSALDLHSIYVKNNKHPFRVKCKRCYYRNYNDILHSLWNGLVHPDFI